MDADAVVNKVMNEEVGILKDLGFLWPNFKGKMVAYAILYYASLIFFFVGCHTSFFFLVDDLHVFFLNINYSLLFYLAISLPLLWKRSREVQITLFRMVVEGFSEYKIKVPVAVSGAIRQRVEKELYVFVIVLVASSVAAGFVVFSSSIDGYFGIVQNKTSDYITYELPLQIYVPFKLHQSFWGLVALMTSELLDMFFIVLTILSSELFFVKFCQKIFYEQEILIWSLRNIEERVQESIQGFELESSMWMPWLDFCLTENIKHHQRIKRFIVLFSQLSGPMLLSAWFIGTIAIALSLYEAAQGSVSFGKILSSGSLAVAEVLNVFILSRMGQHIIDLEEVIFEEVCFLPWYKFSVPTRSKLLNFLTGTLHPNVLKAGNLVPMNYDSFATAMNSAYSFFNILSARKIN